MEIKLIGIQGMPLVERGNDIPELIVRALDFSGQELMDGDISNSRNHSVQGGATPLI